MFNSVVTAVLGSTLGLIGMTGATLAGSIGRYDCIIVGTIVQEPIGDRDGHQIVSFEYTCRGLDGLLKDAGTTAISVSEWDGQKGNFIASVGLHRAPGGFAVGQLVEGRSSIATMNDKASSIEGSGTTVFKFASGTLAAISGQTAKFTAKPTGPGRFEIEFTD